MKAVIYQAFQGPIAIEEVADPIPPADGVVIQVRACGLCRSDWHGWMGHDGDITPPMVPGHELAGIIAAVGDRVSGAWRVGDRVTVPFCCGCGHCEQCADGQQQICDNYFQPGFTGWGAFAELVAIRYADTNLVCLPDDVDFATAASLGCRFITAYRAICDQGQVGEGQWVAVHGCGGVGLSAIMIARARGARVVAVDIHPGALALATRLGAEVVVNGHSDTSAADVAAQIREATSGGVHVSMDALGSAQTCQDSILSLRKRGRHVQVGLLPATDGTPVPMDAVIARELELVGSHGMQAHRYPEMMAHIRAGTLAPQDMVTGHIGLAEVPAALTAMDQFAKAGVTVAVLP